MYLDVLKLYVWNRHKNARKSLLFPQSIVYYYRKHCETGIMMKCHQESNLFLWNWAWKPESSDPYEKKIDENKQQSANIGRYKPT